MLIRHVCVVAAAIAAIACDLTGDNSAIIKTQAAVKPGMAIWDAVGQADAIQLPDIFYTVSGKECGHAGVEAGRYSGLSFLKMFHGAADKDDLMVMRPYTEHGYATRDEFVEALKANAAVFANCNAIVFSFMRGGGWPSTDWFEVTVDKHGQITTVGPVVGENQ